MKILDALFYGNISGVDMKKVKNIKKLAKKN